ncbi:uncharacterized protein LOC132192420 isoform X2 [Neocloeon triangulifer]|uniref:uncharacterized protein LOC132192420 isoform X2 n=1 Tax=Neocloeon triangulifer TaxID=2078957 RepID=UPI00286FA5A8|nr:uncharacterized protein LOC132192420 isoform X2 [Neocloeon triangulifer]
MQVQCLLLVLLAASGLASPTPSATDPKSRTVGLRNLFIGCLNSESESENGTGDFMSCLNRRLRDSGGELRLLPGVTLSSENIDMSGNGKRAMSGSALKVALPWPESSARFFGGWSNPSLVLSGGESELDIGVEVDKDEPAQPGDEETGRAKKLKKLLIPLMIGLKLKSALFSMLSYGAVIAMAAKALLLSIVAVAIAGIGAMRRMYKDYSEATVHSYSSYEPSYPSSSYHHRSYGSSQPLGAASNPLGNLAAAATEVQAQAQQQPNYSAHDMAYYQQPQQPQQRYGN